MGISLAPVGDKFQETGLAVPFVLTAKSFTVGLPDTEWGVS